MMPLAAKRPSQPSFQDALSNCPANLVMTKASLNASHELPHTSLPYLLAIASPVSTLIGFDDHEDTSSSGKHYGVQIIASSEHQGLVLALHGG